MVWVGNVEYVHILNVVIGETERSGMLLTMLESLVFGWVERSDMNMCALNCICVRIFCGLRATDFCTEFVMRVGV